MGDVSQTIGSKPTERRAVEVPHNPQFAAEGDTGSRMTRQPAAAELHVRPSFFESRICWEILQRWNEQRIGRGSRLSGL
jgi:hypothetical protein